MFVIFIHLILQNIYIFIKYILKKKKQLYKQFYITFLTIIYFLKINYVK